MRPTVSLLLCSLCCSLALTTCTRTPDWGDEGEECYPNDTCNAGFACIDGRCESLTADCGNGVCDPDETQSSCPQDCNNGSCGNDIIDPAEACDGSQLAGHTCATLPDHDFSGGTLACLGDCSAFDTTHCSTTVCGDLVINIPEVCDASNIGGRTCVDEGYLTGTLGCSADCLSFDTTRCSMSCDEADCPTCLTSLCAITACQAEWASCQASPECLAIVNCLSGCYNVTCKDQCVSLHPQGAIAFDAIWSCLVCSPSLCRDECQDSAICP